MLHLIKYSFLTKIREPSLVFWPLVFPLILATLFQLAFGRMEEADFETVQMAVVREEGEEGGEEFLTFLETVREEDEDFIEIREMSREQAGSALEEKEISGIFYVGENIRLVVGENGIPQSILQSLLESYENGKQILKRISEEHPEGLPAAIRQMSQHESSVQQVSLGGKTTNGNAQFFYALIAMACLYGAFIGFGAVEGIQADLQPLAARRCVTPTRKLALILTEMSTSFALHFGNVFLLLLYIRYGLKQDLNGSMAQMLPVIFMGSMIGVTLGIFVGSIRGIRQGAKVGIILGISMSCSFFAGLMGGNMKNIIEKHIPVLNRINPAALISDAFYSVNVYEDPVRYTGNLMILGGMTAFLILISFLRTRGERYDSI